MIKNILKNVSLNRNTFSPMKIMNRMQLNQSYIGRFAQPFGFPTVAIIEMTNRCNLQCVMCPRSKQTRSTGVMSYALFWKIIKQIRGKVELVDLDLFGEILMHPDFAERIEVAKGAGLRTSVSTNGTLLGAENSQRLIDSSLDVLTISLDGATQKTYGSIRKGGNYKKTVANVKRFLEINNGRVYTIVQMVNMSMNEHEINKFRKFWKDSGVDAVRIKQYLDMDRSMHHLRTRSSIETASPCIFPWRWIVITWDGKVVPCCNDYDNLHVLGDLNESTIKNIWNGEKMRAFREAHIEHRKDELELCNGCRQPTLSNGLATASVFVDEYNRFRLQPFVKVSR